MNGETVLEITKVLVQDIAPGWVLAIVVCAILAQQSPKLLHELFAGVAKLKGLRTSKSQK